MKTKAFTLIELLVVIAIIAILAAILFPVFAQAKTAAKITKSLSNVKQLGTSMMIYTADYDDTIPPEYGNGTDADPNQYHNTDTWVGRIYPYVKNKQIFFDPTLNESPKPTLQNELYADPYYCSGEGCYYSYTWQWVTTYALNTDGFSNYYSGGTCENGYDGTYANRTMTNFSEPASRLMIAPMRYGSWDAGWMRFISRDASWPLWMDQYAPEWYWEQLIWDARKQYPNARFVGVFADGHAAKFSREKFLSRQEAPDRATWCSLFQSKGLDKFWGSSWKAE